jgi:DNA-binding MarR family transcriptional regulator
MAGRRGGRRSVILLALVGAEKVFSGARHLTIVVMTTIVTGMSSKSQEELKQKRRLTSLEEEVYLGIVRTAAALSWGVSETLKSAELTPTQYNVLRILRGAGEEGASCGQISERMITKDSDITRLLERLDARGLITRAREGQDRRYIIARITPEGLRLLAGLDEPIAEYHRRQIGHLGKERLAALGKLLNAARENKV